METTNYYARGRTCSARILTRGYVCTGKSEVGLARSKSGVVVKIA